MTHDPETPVIAFAGHRRIAAGPLGEVAPALAAHPDALVILLHAETSAPIDLPPGLAAAEAARPGRGRPRLGVTPREVTLMPRHWAWLAGQDGGASATLRRLVEAAMRSGAEDRRRARDAAYRFMSTVAGDLPGFEEATRALYADRWPDFLAQVAAWPEDVRAHAEHLAAQAWEERDSPQA